MSRVIAAATTNILMAFNIVSPRYDGTFNLRFSTGMSLAF
jgi:hypothetical protein